MHEGVVPFASDAIIPPGPSHERQLESLPSALRSNVSLLLVMSAVFVDVRDESADPLAFFRERLGRVDKFDPLHKVAALQPAARGHEPRGR